MREYYQVKAVHLSSDKDAEEADKVAANIAQILGERSFTFNAGGYISIHRHLFGDIFEHAGQLRDYDITKKEWVLCGDSVLYGRWQDLRMALDYDIAQEKEYSYKGLDKRQIVERLARFFAGIWQIHPFREGNTRTTAVFAIKYLRSLGFNADK